MKSKLTQVRKPKTKKRYKMRGGDLTIPPQQLPQLFYEKSLVEPNYIPNSFVEPNYIPNSLVESTNIPNTHTHHYKIENQKFNTNKGKKFYQIKSTQAVMSKTLPKKSEHFQTPQKVQMENINRKQPKKVNTRIFIGGAKKRSRCSAQTAKGKRCSFKAKLNRKRCGHHQH
jgi:hypothetical protein